ncbi:sensor domain-containing diguanylate cyclase [Undibacterium sp.]|jgi:diguanylate cyclase (GGDEF)-like protein|uniref:sensor domain-containing diguanylate cyclase n=1 Tax=Undibacterium sp. TaxID=1914977 RepID=UPI002CEF2C07|nr:sensor domain-containing diguanylate cyclase [Undibacterium sp.]HTD05997.1 sensor domain-containing diguanylate cyclase [Undibacterium sp.]
MISQSPPPHRFGLISKRISITSLAVGFVVLVCASLVFIDGWRSWTARKVQLRETEVATANMARAIAQHADDTIKEADTALIGLSERIQSDGTSPAALDRLHKLLVRRVSELSQLNGLFVYDESGKWLANSQPSVPANANNSDRDYFIYHRSHRDPNPYIGPPIRSRSTGAWILTVSRRIDNADGSFGGVALATINIDYFNKFYDSFNIGNAGSIVLVSDRGILLTRRPLLADSIGKSMVDTPLFRDNASKKTSGAFTVASAQDGVRRQNSFRHLDKYPLFVAAALSESEVLADWWADTYLHSAGVAALLVVLGSLGFPLIRQIKLRLDAEAEIVRTRDAMQVLNQTLERLSLQDGLTELANRRHFDTALSEEFSRATRNASSLALIMIDVDHFKRYNDIYGHAAGDECLRKISKIVKTGQNRPGDLAARYGGEELCVLLPGADVAGAMAVAEKIRLEIHNLEIAHAGNPAGVVTISAGVDAFSPVRNVDQPLHLVQAADKELYAAKNSGRDRVCSNSSGTTQLNVKIG